MPRHEVTPAGAGEFVRPRFGVEIEFNGSALRRSIESIVDDLNLAGIDCNYESYNHTVRASRWKLTTDSSCGYELVSPPLHFEDRWSIGVAMEVLRASGAKVNRNCGFHVHHEWPWQSAISADYTRAVSGGERETRLCQLLWMYDKYLPLLTVLIPKERLSTESQYTKTNKTLNIRYMWSDDRYVAINFTPLGDGRNTVEFRQHQGTLNVHKAIAWVEFTRRLMAVTNQYIPGVYSEDPEERKEWEDQMHNVAEVALKKLSPSARSYIINRCHSKGTTLGDVVAQVNNRRPTSPLNYGISTVMSAHDEEIAETGFSHVNDSDEA